MAERKCVSKEECDARHSVLDKMFELMQRSEEKNSKILEETQATNVKLTMISEQLAKQSQDHEDRLRVQENKPSKKWENAKWLVFSIILTALLMGLIEWISK